MVFVNLDPAVLFGVLSVLLVDVLIYFFPLTLLHHLSCMKDDALFLGLSRGFLESFLLVPPSFKRRLLEELWWIFNIQHEVPAEHGDPCCFSLRLVLAQSLLQSSVTSLLVAVTGVHLDAVCFIKPLLHSFDPGVGGFRSCFYSCFQHTLSKGNELLGLPFLEVVAAQFYVS